MPTVDTPPFLTTGELGDLIAVQSWRIARLFELGLLPEPPRSGGRRQIPKEMVPDVVDALRLRGWLPESEAAAESAAPVGTGVST